MKGRQIRCLKCILRATNHSTVSPATGHGPEGCATAGIQFAWRSGLPWPDDRPRRYRFLRLLARKSTRTPIPSRPANGSRPSTRWSKPKAASARPSCCASCSTTPARGACRCRRCSTRPYKNSIALAEQPQFPGNLELESRISAIVRWNALAMVVRANRAHPELGGHIASYASAADLFEVGFNHFFRAPTTWCTSSRIRRPAYTREHSWKAGSPRRTSPTTAAKPAARACRPIATRT